MSVPINEIILKIYEMNIWFKTSCHSWVTPSHHLSVRATLSAVSLCLEVLGCITMGSSAEQTSPLSPQGHPTSHTGHAKDGKQEWENNWERKVFRRVWRQKWWSWNCL